jgi:hypothetical protein
MAQSASGFRALPCCSVRELGWFEQASCTAPQCNPSRCRRFQLATALFVRAVCLDPTSQRRPSGYHYFVCKIDGHLALCTVLIDRQQASRDEPLQDVLKVAGVAIRYLQLRARLLSACIGASLAEASGSSARSRASRSSISLLRP